MFIEIPGSQFLSESLDLIREIVLQISSSSLDGASMFVSVHKLCSVQDAGACALITCSQTTRFLSRKSGGLIKKV
jgi:hypothetical protein